MLGLVSRGLLTLQRPDGEQKSRRAVLCARSESTSLYFTNRSVHRLAEDLQGDKA